jgi:hypothetical protein
MIADGCVLYLLFRRGIVQSVAPASNQSAPDRYNSHYQLFSFLNTHPDACTANAKQPVNFGSDSPNHHKKGD